MTELTSMTCEELIAWMKESGEQAFRGKQVFRWIHQGRDFDEMTNLPQDMRKRLQAICIAQPVKILLKKVSRIDGTVKFLFGLQDGNCVEGVLMRYKYGYSLCISTQVGCRMGCKFCASTLDGRIRNLSAGEMLGQVLCANRFLSERPAESNREEPAEFSQVSHIVLMGSGEPLDNYDAVIRFLHLLKEEEGIHLSLRGVSLSTCGLVPEMYRLAEEHLPVTLCVSLHAPNDEIRRKTMPIANRYRISEILEACRNYIAVTGRRVIFEYALVDGLNAGKAQAEELAGLLRGMQCHVNLIPLNAVKERKLAGVNEETVRSFLNTLTAHHISATRRREMGDDIDGACGQLRRKTLTNINAR